MDLYFDSSVYGFIDACSEAKAVRRWLPAERHRLIVSDEANIGEASRFRIRQPEPDGSSRSFRPVLAKWVEAKSAELQEAWPAMPEGLTDRPADCWEPLLAVADLAAGAWPERARRAALKLNDERRKADPSLGVRLLADIRSALDGRDRITTADLLEVLVEMDESRWGDLRGKSLDSRALARRLKPFGIGPKVIRIGNDTPRGYERSDFVDAWRRYLPSPPGNSATSATTATTSSEAVADELSVALPIRNRMSVRNVISSSRLRMLRTSRSVGRLPAMATVLLGWNK